MAQKRNPVSLRLQTRLQGYEKRFASCWFTDSFFSQVCTNDLFLRLYYGHLLQKGGSWYGEINKSRLPESCVSLQFLYRKCSILSAILDRRKEEYTSLGTNTRTQQEVLSLQSESALSNITTNKDTRYYHKDTSKKVDDKEHTSLARKESYTESMQEMHAKQLPVFAYPRISKSSDGAIYPSMANAFTSISTQYKSCIRLSCLSESKSICAVQTLSLLCIENKKQDKQSDSCYSRDRGCLSLIESICDTYREGKKGVDNLTHKNSLVCAKRNDENQTFVLSKKDSLYKHLVSNSLDIAKQYNNKNNKQEKAISYALPVHWTCINMVRAVSAYQNVEFCLHSVALLYSQRFPFLKIKEALFKKLAEHPNVRGARLMCSGRQGGRSKSAMRAKKQCAILGRTALSLFSSRLAFASTNCDTSFGQIGIKLWICYK